MAPDFVVTNDVVDVTDYVVDVTPNVVDVTVLLNLFLSQMI